MYNLEDKIVVVTGGARGIGFSITQKFAKQGAISIILDLDQDAIDKTVKEIDDAGYRALGYNADVTNNKAIKKLFKKIYNEFGKIDILVNNAGITKDGLLMKMKEEDWDKVITVNLKGTYNCTQAISRYLLKQREGVIINIASIIGIMGNAGQANYAASKGGIIALTKSTAKEFAARNIRVNSIAPGFIKTKMTDKLSDEIIDSYSKAIPLSRMGLPEDVANLCIFLASDQSSYITGQTINIDGGLIM